VTAKTLPLRSGRASVTPAKIRSGIGVLVIVKGFAFSSIVFFCFLFFFVFVFGYCGTVEGEIIQALRAPSLQGVTPR
jgi:hypothetical protein